MYCTRCGKQIENGSRFCKYCGCQLDHLENSRFNVNNLSDNLSSKKTNNFFVVPGDPVGNPHMKENIPILSGPAKMPTAMCSPNSNGTNVFSPLQKNEPPKKLMKEDKPGQGTKEFKSFLTRNAKRLLIGGAAVLLVSLVILVCSLMSRPSVIKEIYTGSEYYTDAESKEYVESLLGSNVYLYENDYDYAYYNLRDADAEVRYLDRTVCFSDGTDVTLPCSYSDIKSKGWSSKEKESETFVTDNVIYCTNSNGSVAGFRRTVEDIRPTIMDSKIEGVEIGIGSFAKKENYALITTRDLDFTYMGINRDSTPAQVIQKIGLPDSIDFDVNMTFEYSLYDSDAGRWLRVQFCWLKLKDGPEIMRDFRILYSEGFKLLW